MTRAGRVRAALSWWLLCGTLLFALAPSRALGQSAQGGERSALENSVIEEGLAFYGWEPEEDPTGKKVESIEIYALEVFDRRDPVPQFLNVFHTKSRDRVIRREVLIQVGELWSRSLVQETERNLRGLRQISLANIAVARGSTPETIRLLVVVKDVWSLRVNSNLGLGGEGLEYLLINPAEENLAGTHVSLGLLYRLDPFRHTWGARLMQPRLAGSRYGVAIQGAGIWGRETQEWEGSSGQFVFEKPLYSLRTQFSHGTRVAWFSEMTRRTLGTGLRSFEVESDEGQVEALPWMYRTERLAADYYATHSWGILNKLDLKYGLEIDHRRYREPDLSAYSDRAQEAFLEHALPVSDVRVSPYVQLRTYQGKFHRTLYMEILGLQEDFWLGYQALLRVFVAGQRLGSSRDLVGTYAALGASWPWETGLIRLVVESRNVLASEARHEGVLVGAGRVASPLWGPGRLHLDAVVAHRYYDYMNVVPYSLGGNNRLRGYRYDEFQGKDFLAVNAEYRSRSVDILSAQVGAAVFYDWGDAPATLAEFSPKQSVGAGLRILFPQVERTLLRFDYALPLTDRAWTSGGAVYLTFGQAFGLSGIGSPSVTQALSGF